MARLRRRLWLPVLGGLCLWLALVAARIWRFGSEDHARPADCIIVLGAAVVGEAPSPVFEERIRHGVALYRKRIADRLLFTGGFGEGNRVPESAAAAAFALELGVDPGDVLAEARSRTTRQNLVEARALMREHDLHSAVIVSDPLHMKRAMAMAEDLGIDAVSSPTPTSRYRSPGAKFAFLMRELCFWHVYQVFGR